MSEGYGRDVPEDEDPPVDAAVVGTAASMDPSGTTLLATAVAGAVGVVVGAGRRVLRTFRPDRPDTGARPDAQAPDAQARPEPADRPDRPDPI